MPLSAAAGEQCLCVSRVAGRGVLVGFRDSFRVFRHFFMLVLSSAEATQKLRLADAFRGVSTGAHAASILGIGGTPDLWRNAGFACLLGSLWAVVDSNHRPWD